MPCHIILLHVGLTRAQYLDCKMQLRQTGFPTGHSFDYKPLFPVKNCGKSRDILASSALWIWSMGEKYDANTPDFTLFFHVLLYQHGMTFDGLFDALGLNADVALRGGGAAVLQEALD